MVSPAFLVKRFTWEAGPPWYITFNIVSVSLVAKDAKVVAWVNEPRPGVMYIPKHRHHHPQPNNVNYSKYLIIKRIHPR
jgi:hypothetical protein